MRLKNPAFKEEAEWRIIKERIGYRDQKLKYYAKRETLVPYVDIDLPVAAVDEGGRIDGWIKSVRLGPKNITPPQAVIGALEWNGPVDVRESKCSYR